MYQKNKLVTLAFGAVLALVVANAGCAKKTKPDVQDLSDNSIANKDMSFDIQGSDSGQITGLSSIHFDFDKSNLTLEARQILVQDASWLKKHSGDSLEIQGHCDRHGSEEYNLALGERRAKVVKEYMVSLGVSGKRLSTISYGKEKLLDTAETDEADAKNRRANLKPIVMVKNLTAR